MIVQFWTVVKYFTGSLQTKKFDTHVDKTMIFKTLKK